MTSDLFGLLTRIRVSKVPMDLEKAAAQQHLFVLVGLVVGLIVTAFSVLLYDLLGRGLAQESAVIVIITLYSITGILHTEGLADFADGVMAGGTPERKRAAMKDVHLLRVEVKTRDPVIVLRASRGVGIRRQASARPIADLIRERGGDQELDFRGELAVLVRVDRG